MLAPKTDTDIFSCEHTSSIFEILQQFSEFGNKKPENSDYDCNKYQDLSRPYETDIFDCLSQQILFDTIAGFLIV